MSSTNTNTPQLQLPFLLGWKMFDQVKRVVKETKRIHYTRHYERRDTIEDDARVTHHDARQASLSTQRKKSLISYINFRLLHRRRCGVGVDALQKDFDKVQNKLISMQLEENKDCT